MGAECGGAVLCADVQDNEIRVQGECNLLQGMMQFTPQL